MIILGFYSEDIIQQVQTKADIVELISEYTSLQRRNDSYLGLCPFHSEKTPSFNVNPDKQLFYCFGCGIGGNVFTFLMKKENLTFPEAVKWLAEKYHIQLPDGYNKEMSDEFKEKLKLLKVNRLVAEYYNHNLLNAVEGKKALNYLKKRDITSDTIELFLLGYALPSWDGLIRFARAKNIDISILEKLGLVIQRRDKKGFYDRFRDRLMFPIEDITKNVIGFGGRIIGQGEPKYLNSPETPVFSKGENLYSLSKIKRDPDMKIIIVEGYMDCITLHQNGYTQTVASLGTALTQSQAKLLKKFSNNVILSYDADSAGRAATLRGMEILAKEGLNVCILNLPEGKDPDDFIRLKGKAAFGQQLDKAIDLISYKLLLAKKGLNPQIPGDKIEYIEKAVDILSQIQTDIDREIYIQKLSKELNISENLIRNEIKKKQLPNNGFKYKNSQLRYNNKEFNKILPISRFYKAEEDIIKLFIENKDARAIIRQNLSPDNFTGEDTKKIAEIIFKMSDEDCKTSISHMLNYIDEKTAKEFSKIMMTDAKHLNNDVITPLIITIKEGHLKRSIQQVREQIKKFEMLGEKEKSFDLLNTYKKLKAEMNELRHYTPRKGGA